MRRSILLAAVWILGALAPGATQTASWITFSPPGGRFSVRLPVDPTTHIHPVSNPFVVQYLARSGDDSYLVIEAEYEAMGASLVDDELTQNRDSLVGGLKGTVVSSSPWRYRDHPGMQWVADIPGPPARTLTARMFIRGLQGYMLVALVPKDADRSKEIAAFFDSFALGPVPR